MSRIKIVEYLAKHQPYFEKFNRSWIEKYFWMEEVDEHVLTNPEQAIIEPGGAIIMAEYDGVPAGTVALLKVSENVYEFTKMAVDSAYRRNGIAEALSIAAFEKASILGATKVILYSNTHLKAAILLYHKLGFKEVPIEQGVYERANIKMEIKLKECWHSVKAINNYI